MLTLQQKTEILFELRNDIPTCPLIIKSNETKKTTNN